MPEPLVTVVLPCLNEAESVGACVSEALASLWSSGLTAEVVVVDNGSDDDSCMVAERSGARVVHQPERGYGSALRAGIAAARGSVVVMADADCSYDLSRAADVARPVLDGEADIVLGARRELSPRSMPTLHRFVGSPVLAFLVARASGGGPRVRDTQSGFRAFRRDVMLGLSLRTTGMEFASEMLIRAAQGGLRVAEVPTIYRPRVGASKLRTFRDGWRHLRLILALAPDLLLVVPGIALLVLGTALSVLAILQPEGTRLGSLRWQPVFFSSIALVVGTQALLAGAILAHRLASIGGSAFRRFRVVGHPRFLSRLAHAGWLLGAAGLLIDVALFVSWVTQRPAPSRGMALAGLAQSLVIVGTTVVMFTVVANALLYRSAGAAAASPAP